MGVTIGNVILSTSCISTSDGCVAFFSFKLSWAWGSMVLFERIFELGLEKSDVQAENRGSVFIPRRLSCSSPGHGVHGLVSEARTRCVFEENWHPKKAVRIDLWLGLPSSSEASTS